MYKADWRSPAAYLPLKGYGRAGFAWEIVRRNPDYANEYEWLDSKSPTDGGEADKAAKRWGLRILSDPFFSCDQQPIFWLPEVLPTILEVQSARQDLTFDPLDLGPLLNHPDTQIHRICPTDDVVIARPDGEYRLWLDQENAEAMAIVIPIDRLFEYRTAAALNFWRALRGLRPGPDPMPLSDFARGQLILILRLIDAQHDGATEREAAAVILNAKADNRRDWIGSEHRARLKRLLARGSKLLAGGYFQLLNPPPRHKRKP
jgi:hypothetical protein